VVFFTLKTPSSLTIDVFFEWLPGLQVRARHLFKKSQEKASGLTCCEKMA
jgi:hypothetical protein